MPVLLWLCLLKTERESCLQPSDLWSLNSGWRINLLCTSQEHRQRKRFSCCPLIHSDLSLFPSDVLHILPSTHFSQCKASLRFFPPSQSRSSWSRPVLCSCKWTKVKAVTMLPLETPTGPCQCIPIQGQRETGVCLSMLWCKLHLYTDQHAASRSVWKKKTTTEYVIIFVIL